MAQPGYQPGSEGVYWWKVAMHLDEANIALANAMAHNLDDPTPVFALQDKLREAQVILLEIFRAKGLLPGSTNGSNGTIDPVALAPNEPAVPEADHVAEVIAEVPVTPPEPEGTAQVAVDSVAEATTPPADPIAAEGTDA